MPLNTQAGGPPSQFHGDREGWPPFTARFQHWSDRECPANWEAKHYARNEPWQGEIFRFLAEKSAEGGVAIADLLPAFRATEEFRLVFEEDPRWNRRGHALGPAQK